MRTWTLERAKNAFSEVVRRALAGEPQLVVRGGREEESVVVVARVDYDRTVSPPPLVEFLRDSPLARAVARGSFGDPATADPFPRTPDTGRDVRFD